MGRPNVQRWSEFWVIVQRTYAQYHMRLFRALGHKVRATFAAEAPKLPWGWLIGA
jgi:hypothetical protein